MTDIDSSLEGDYQLFSSPHAWLEALLYDIEQAKQYIFIETFRFTDDIVGKNVAKALIKKVKSGVSVKLIVDSWGTRRTALFKQMSNAGIEVRFFKKIIFSIFIFSKNHERNHRKIIAIDDRISYIGSANFSQYSLKWRESVLRIQGDIATIFKKIFLDNFRSYKRSFKPRKYYKTIHFKEFLIIREAPSIRHQQTRKYFIKLLNKAQRTFTVITPYFLPGKAMRKKMMLMAKKGVKVQIIIPKRSDVAIVDYMRNIYLGKLHLKGVDIRLYQNENIHAKLLLVDNALFALGSSNLDYRSFRYMYEINLSGKNEKIANLIHQYIEETLPNCTHFDYSKWLKRPIWQRFVALFLLPFKRLL